MTAPIQLEGSPEQVRELHRMLTAQKGILMSLGGDDMRTDMLIEERLQKASYWLEQCQAKLDIA